MSEPCELVEHFFRHEFGRFGAVLTRSLGVRRLDLVEDVVQAALVQAVETWSRRGAPEDPAGWLGGEGGGRLASTAPQQQWVVNGRINGYTVGVRGIIASQPRLPASGGSSTASPPPGGKRLGFRPIRRNPTP
jgi:hypothetical protein